jgi:hypothetical protein
LGRYCNFDSDCTVGASAFTGGVKNPNYFQLNGGSNSKNTAINPYWDCSRNEAGKDGGFCGYGMDHGQFAICDFTKHECQPSCKIGGCFCTENRQCDSHICYKFHCKSIGFSPAWTLTISAFIVIVTTLLCFVWHLKCRKQYLIANAIPSFGVYSDAALQQAKIIN